MVQNSAVSLQSAGGNLDLLEALRGGSRRKSQSELLRDQSLTPAEIGSYNGIQSSYPISQGFNKIAQGLLATYMENDAKNKAETAAKEQQTEAKDYATGFAGAPAVAAQPGVDAQFGSSPGPAVEGVTPESVGDAQIRLALARQLDGPEQPALPGQRVSALGGAGAADDPGVAGSAAIEGRAAVPLTEAERTARLLQGQFSTNPGINRVAQHVSDQDAVALRAQEANKSRVFTAEQNRLARAAASGDAAAGRVSAAKIAADDRNERLGLLPGQVANAQAFTTAATAPLGVPEQPAIPAQFGSAPTPGGVAETPEAYKTRTDLARGLIGQGPLPAPLPGQRVGTMQGDAADPGVAGRDAIPATPGLTKEQQKMLREGGLSSPDPNIRKTAAFLLGKDAAVDAAATKAEGKAEGDAAKRLIVPTPALTRYNEHLTQYKNAQMNIDQIDKNIERITNGSLQFSLLGNAGDTIRNATGATSEQSRNKADYQNDVMSLANAVLTQARGTQTEGDARRALALIQSNINDPKIVETQLKKLRNMAANAMDTAATTLNIAGKSYPGLEHATSAMATRLPEVKAGAVPVAQAMPPGMTSEQMMSDAMDLVSRTPAARAAVEKRLNSYGLSLSK